MKREEGVRSVITYFNLAEIIISLVLVLVLLVQTRGPGFNGTFNSDSSVFRSRRGIEKTLFQLTIILAVVFVIISVLSVVVAKSPTA
ncbi:MAG TPA: preprotein translocase subunit SecG [Chloroflexota bacterium]